MRLHPRSGICILHLLIGLLIGPTLPVPAQDQTQPVGLPFSRLTIDDGLPSSRVLMARQDPQGFMWVATSGGLARYDGYEFHIYLPQPDDSTGIGGIDITGLYVDPEGDLWVLVQDGRYGLYRYDRTTDHFTRAPCDIQTNTSAWVSFPMLESTTEPDVLWVGGLNGLFRYDRQRNICTSYTHDPDDPNGLPGPLVLSILENDDGTFWLGGWGVTHFDPQTEQFSSYLPDPTQSTYVELSVGTNSQTNLVMSLLPETNNRIWVGTRQGLLRFDASGSEPTFQHFLFDASEPFSFSNSVSALLRDENQQLWAGTGREVYLIDEGIADPSGKRITQVFATLAVMGDLFQDRSGIFWAGTYQRGLALFNPNLPQDAFAPRDSLLHGIQGAVGEPFEDRNGTLWIGSYGDGLSRLNPTTNHFSHFRHHPGNPDSLGSDLLLTLYADQNNILWIGTADGLSRLDPATRSFMNFTAPQMRMIMAIREDAQGRFWIGAREGGLHLFDPNTGTVLATYIMQDGLVSNAIEDVIIDDRGLLWIATQNGLSRFDPETQSFKNFTTATGLPGSGRFIERSGLKTRSGEIFFGMQGYDGLIQLDLDKLDRTTPAPAMVLTDFQLSGQSVSIGDGSVLPASISVLEDIELAHTQNDFTAHYSGIESSNQDDVRYAYRLGGYDEQWREAGEIRRATYNNMSPGKYTFEVRAANSDGIWSETKTLGITIRPPWWRTWWAYTLYGLLLLVGVFAIDRFQRRRLIRKERERAQARELEQAREIEKAYHELRQAKDRLVQQEKMASLGELTAGIAHEIKNPLNFITNFAEVNEELAQELREAIAGGEDLSDLIDDLEQNARVINHHGKRADGIVSAMMQHASGGSGKREPTDVNALLEEYVNLAYHGKRAQVEGFNCEIERDYDEAIGTVELIPQDMGRVFLNLLSNAFDAVSEQNQPTVRVQTTSHHDAIEIRVIDNGPGIPINLREKIYEPFFTTKPTGSGTGLGLSMSYDIVTQGHGGSLEVESQPGAGATFTITLPC